MSNILKVLIGSVVFSAAVAGLAVGVAVVMKSNCDFQKLKHVSSDDTKNLRKLFMCKKKKRD